MKNIFAYFKCGSRKGKGALSPSFEVKGCVPMSFGVLFRCVTLQDASLHAGMQLELRSGTRTALVQCLNIEKKFTVTVQETECKMGDEICITVAYTEAIMHFPLEGMTISIVE